mmetsp:Transcript_22154/g.69305  ORF Transcript_22154/g.69305 Transcript_22154/m.69305 type:complete len:435 (+) Transcript_22154:124-1428(+)
MRVGLFAFPDTLVAASSRASLVGVLLQVVVVEVVAVVLLPGVVGGLGDILAGLLVPVQVVAALEGFVVVLGVTLAVPGTELLEAALAAGALAALRGRHAVRRLEVVALGLPVGEPGAVLLASPLVLVVPLGVVDAVPGVAGEADVVDRAGGRHADLEDLRILAERRDVDDVVTGVAAVERNEEAVGIDVEELIRVRVVGGHAIRDAANREVSRVLVDVEEGDAEDVDAAAIAEVVEAAKDAAAPLVVVRVLSPRRIGRVVDEVRALAALVVVVQDADHPRGGAEEVGVGIILVRAVEVARALVRAAGIDLVVRVREAERARRVEGDEDVVGVLGGDAFVDDAVAACAVDGVGLVVGRLPAGGRELVRLAVPHRGARNGVAERVGAGDLVNDDAFANRVEIERGLEEHGGADLESGCESDKRSLHGVAWWATARA